MNLRKLKLWEKHKQIGNLMRQKCGLFYSRQKLC